ncbi:MAG: hypothetical protein FWE77_01900 [Clostridia bacterium]|nr:hypothetical protein [Clostridia bacterium]
MRKHHVIRKCLVMALCACFLAAALGASALAALHGGHHCALSERCAVCIKIRDTQSLMKRLLVVFACCGLPLIRPFLLAGGLDEAAFAVGEGTPVARKVRLNN